MMHSLAIILVALAALHVTALPLDGPTSELSPRSASEPITITLDCGCWNDCTIEQVAKSGIPTITCLPYCDPRYTCPDLPNPLPIPPQHENQARGPPPFPTPNPAAEPLQPGVRYNPLITPNSILTDPVFPLPLTQKLSLSRLPLTVINVPTATNVLLNPPPKPTHVLNRRIDIDGILPPVLDDPVKIVLPTKGWVDPPPPGLEWGVGNGKRGDETLEKRTTVAPLAASLSIAQHTSSMVHMLKTR
ncbi:hypothetical protein B0T16DRAFT_391382 [Cercophora newfieldiana]|uniref:Uncharacterized protein n=1 Tax=Cercophora newfieldiana TaxID=92897 RepID=A0AA39Y8P2_9PEZI|nr:hypothetical protein B0T16DRAFT_391382 [Cercophora newfieldiana]